VETQTKAAAPLTVSSRPTLAKMSSSMVKYKKGHKQPNGSIFTLLLFTPKP